MGLSDMSIRYKCIQKYLQPTRYFTTKTDPVNPLNPQVYVCSVSGFAWLNAKAAWNWKSIYKNRNITTFFSLPKTKHLQKDYEDIIIW